ncbi:hypothetical protein SAMN02910289_01494 [Lachnospiraceae bacterium RM5]|nr:hypothetical protein SAMN02910289_01494 [Lachnospiraceae bacterium RM5]
MGKNSLDSDYYIKEVEKMVNEVEFGKVTLIIQDGRVIQIDKTEKIRLQP